MNLVDALGKALANRRRALGLTQSQVAERAQLHRNAVGLAERGQTSIAVDVLFALADSLQTTASELVIAAERSASTRSRPAVHAGAPEAPKKQVRVRRPRQKGLGA